MDGGAYLVPYGVMIPNRIFVGGVSYTMTDLELKEFFSQFGKVRDSKIITDRDAKSLGYGFVTFESDEEADKVLRKGSLYCNEKKLNVSRAIRKQGGQYNRANREYINGQRQVPVYLHQSGEYLLAHHHGQWMYESLPNHSQPAKPCYSMLPCPPPTPYLQPPGLLPTPVYPQHPYQQPSLTSPTLFYPEPIVHTTSLNKLPQNSLPTPLATTTAALVAESGNREMMRLEKGFHQLSLATAGPPQTIHPEIPPALIRGRHGDSQQQLYPVTCLSLPVPNVQYYHPSLPPHPPPVPIQTVNLPPQLNTYVSIAPVTSVPPTPSQTLTASHTPLSSSQGEEL